MYLQMRPAGDLEHFWFMNNVWSQDESLRHSTNNIKLSTAPGGVSWASFEN